MKLNKIYMFFQISSIKWNSRHCAKVPASYGRIICCGELAAIVVRAPLAGGELELTFALQGGSARDLQRKETTTLSFVSSKMILIQLSELIFSEGHTHACNHSAWLGSNMPASLRPTKTCTLLLTLSNIMD